LNAIYAVAVHACSSVVGKIVEPGAELARGVTASHAIPMSALATAQFIDPSDPVSKQSEITLKKTLI
jgi:hypothetical protein